MTTTMTTIIALAALIVAVLAFILALKALKKEIPDYGEEIDAIKEDIQANSDDILHISTTYAVAEKQGIHTTLTFEGDVIYTTETKPVTTKKKKK